ncbi:MAG: hypothetical protein OXG97_15750 [Candidatus Poribacteria bacterium]|nr:hypothetical protein [Candidatus Poribacteria bacterium]
MNLYSFFNQQNDCEVSPFNYYPEVPQTQEYRSPREEDGRIPPFPVSDLYCFPMTKVEETFKEIREEVEEACGWDDEVEPIPESAYNEARFLLNMFHRFLPMPDIGWLIDGGIGFEWRSRDGKGIATMSIYGDNKVIYGATLGSGQKDKGTCELTDLVKLVRFFPTLKILCSQ